VLAVHPIFALFAFVLVMMSSLLVQGSFNTSRKVLFALDLATRSFLKLLVPVLATSLL